MTIKKAATALKNPRDYKYDTSSYVIFDMKVKRESVTGKLVRLSKNSN